MCPVDAQHLRHPFYRSRRIELQLCREGDDIGRLHVDTLMRRMSIKAHYRKHRTSIPARKATEYPYLLSGVAIERPNQV